MPSSDGPQQGLEPKGDGQGDGDAREYITGTFDPLAPIIPFSSRSPGHFVETPHPSTADVELQEHSARDLPNSDFDTSIQGNRHDVFQFVADATPRHVPHPSSSGDVVTPFPPNTLTIDPPLSTSSKSSPQPSQSPPQHVVGDVYIANNHTDSDGISSARHRPRAGSITGSGGLFRMPSLNPSSVAPQFEEEEEDDEVLDDTTALRHRNRSTAHADGVSAEEFTNEDLENTELSGPPSSLFPYTLRFRNPHLEAMFWGYNLPHYRFYAKTSFLFALILFLVMLIQDVVFYAHTWKDAQQCRDLFSPACRSLGFRIVVSLFFVPAYALMLYLVVHYAETLYDKTHKHVCMIWNKQFPLDLCLSGIFTSGIIVVSRTINTSDAILPVDYTSVCVFLFCLHLTAAFLNQSFAASILSIGTYLGYCATTIGFACADGALLYSQDYAAAATIAKFSTNAVFDMSSRNYEIIWALLWPLFINILSVLGCRAIEINRRKTFALVRAYMLILQENDGLEQQRNEVWNELCKITDNRANMIDTGNSLTKKKGELKKSNGRIGSSNENEGEIDLTAPAEYAMQLLQDIQRDGSVSNEVLMKARQVADILMNPGELYTPAIGLSVLAGDALGVDLDGVGGDDEQDQKEMQRWMSALVNGNKNAVPILPENLQKSGIDEHGQPCILNPNTGNRVEVVDEETQVIPSCLEPMLGGLSTVDVHSYNRALDDWDTDIEDVVRVIGAENILVYTTVTVMRKYNLFNKFHIDPQRMVAFLQSVHSHYHNSTNAFHNAIHAADVVKNVNVLLYHSGLYTVLSDVYILSIILAAVVIDVGHPGIDSNFHIETSHELALVYNDRCVLENYHSAVLFRALLQHGVLNDVTQDRKKQIRSNAIELLLATDLNVHYDVLGQHKTILAGAVAMNLSLSDTPLPHTYIDDGNANGNSEITKESEIFRSPSSTEVMLHKLKLSLLKLVLKSADIGYAAKPLPIHNRWSAYLYDEQFKQGDEERRLGLPISPFMDRDKTNVPLAQIGFIDYIARPQFELMCEALEIDENSVRCMEYIANNRAHWSAMQKQQQQQLLQQQQEVSLAEEQDTV